MTTIMIIGIAVLIAGICIMLLQNIQERRNDSTNELERYIRERDGGGSLSERLNRRVESDLTNRSNRCDHSHSRRDLDGMEEVRRHRVKILITASVILGVTAGIAVSAWSVISNTGMDFSHLQGGEESELYEDGSLKWKKEYGVGGVPSYEYMDLEEGYREILYENEDNYTLKEYDESGALCFLREVEAGAVESEMEFVDGELVTERLYQWDSTRENRVPEAIYQYDSEGTMTEARFYGENGTLQMEDLWEGNTGTSTEYDEDDGTPRWQGRYLYDDQGRLRQITYLYNTNGELEVESISIAIPGAEAGDLGQESYLYEEEKLLWAVATMDSRHHIYQVIFYTIGKDGDPEDYIEEHAPFWYGVEEHEAEAGEYVVDLGSDGTPVGFHLRTSGA